MKNVIIIAGLVFALVFSSAFAQLTPKAPANSFQAKEIKQEKKDVTNQAEKKKDKKASKPIKGVVIDFADWLKGGSGKVSKDQAIKLAESGSPIVFLVVNGKSAKIYFVVNTDGSFNGRKLANYANNKTVGIIGKTKKVNGMNIIIAEMIESMD